MSEQGITSEFGQSNLEDMFTEEVPEESEAPEETPETPEVPAAPEEPAQEEEPTEAPQAEQEEVEEAPEPEQPLYGGKFKTPEAVLEAYENAERMAHQRSREAADVRRQHGELQEALRRAEPLIRQAMQQQQEADEQFDPYDPESVQQAIRNQAAQEAERIVAERMAPLEQQRQDAALRELDDFRSAHPDALQHESSIYSVFSDYRYDGQEEVFPPTRDNLEIAYTLATRPEVKALVDSSEYIPDTEMVTHALEAAESPSLMEVVEANPQFLTSIKGMAYARKLAGMPQVVTTAKNAATQAQQQAQKAARTAAYVEKGDAQAPVGAPPEARDPLEAALFDEEQTKRSVFG